MWQSLICIGAPLQEPVAMGANIIMNSQQDRCISDELLPRKGCHLGFFNSDLKFSYKPQFGGSGCKTWFLKDMVSSQELAEANGDLRAGYFGPSWEHTEDDTEWMRRGSNPSVIWVVCDTSRQSEAFHCRAIVSVGSISNNKNRSRSKDVLLLCSFLSLFLFWVTGHCFRTIQEHWRYMAQAFKWVGLQENSTAPWVGSHTTRWR